MFSGNNLEILCLKTRVDLNSPLLPYSNLHFKGTLMLFPDHCTNLNPHQQRLILSLVIFFLRAIFTFSKVTALHAFHGQCPPWTGLLNFFPHSFWLFLCLLWRNVCSTFLPILNLRCLLTIDLSSHVFLSLYPYKFGL